MLIKRDPRPVEIVMIFFHQGDGRRNVAERSKLSITALYNIENNLSFPSKDTIDRLCASLGIPVSFLMFYSLTEDDVPEEKRAFFKTAVGPVKAFLMSK